MLRWTLIVAFLAVSGTAAAATRDSAAPRPLRCPPRGQAVIAANSEVRVYRPKIGTGPADVAVGACVVGRRTRMTLVPSTERPARFGGGGSIDEIALAGHVVAYVVHRRVGVDTGASELIVADVARRFILRETAVGYSVDAGLVADEDLTALVVTPAGAVAWIAARHGIPIRPAAATVYAAAPTSGVTVLDEGPKIDPASLKLTGSTLSWTDAAGVRTGAMP